MLKRFLATSALLLTPILIAGQGKGVDPKELLKPLADSWPTFSGDYTGRRYSALTDVNRLTVKNLTLAWVAEVVPGPGGGGRGGGGGRPVIIGGEGPGDPGGASGSTVKGTPLMGGGTA